MAKEYFVHETAVIDDGCSIGKGTRIWHFSHIMQDSVIGENCNLGQNVVVSPGVKLGSNVKVQNNVSIYTGVICEDDVFLGPSMVFTNIVNPRSAVIRKDQYVETVVGKGASIGANATIVCGNNIGKYAFIGAGAVVTREVKPYSLVIGNPARHTGWISEFGHKLVFNEEGEASCPESGDKYRLINGEVSRINC
jgi:UDP-2-acetamido-3-amino-2,3-dideoxy-glucuronate N-acetyltransferase